MNDLDEVRKSILSAKESQQESIDKEIKRVVDEIVKVSKTYKVDKDGSIAFEFHTSLSNKNFAELAVKLYTENKIFIERTKVETSGGCGIYDNGRTYLTSAIKVSFID